MLGSKPSKDFSRRGLCCWVIEPVFGPPSSGMVGVFGAMSAAMVGR